MKEQRQKYMRGIGTAIAVILLIAMAGCGTGKKAANGEAENQQSADAVVTQQTEEREEETTELVEEVQYATAKEWVDSLELETPTLLIWNEQTLESRVLGEGEEYQLKENDEILIGGVAGLRDIDCNPAHIFETLDTSVKEYVKLGLEIEGRQDVSMSLTIKGKEYEVGATFIGVSGEIMTEEEGITTIDKIDVHSDLPGEEWVASFGTEIEEPFMVVWNDMEGTKKILETGEKYQVKEEDTFFLYYPEYNYVEGISPWQIAADGIVGMEDEHTFQLDRDYIEENGVEVSFFVSTIDGRVELTYTFTK